MNIYYIYNTILLEVYEFNEKLMYSNCKHVLAYIIRLTKHIAKISYSFMHN